MFNIKQTTLQSKQCPKINHPGVSFQTIIEGGSVVVVRYRCGENFGWGGGVEILLHLLFEKFSHHHILPKLTDVFT